jgi:hypothetical protein
MLMPLTLLTSLTVIELYFVVSCSGDDAVSLVAVVEFEFL